MDSYFRPTRAIVSLDALERNIQAFRRALPTGTRIMAVVKANAYGHGAVEIARWSAACGADYVGVAFLDEAIELRRAGITSPILVLGYTPLEGIELAVEYGLTLTVFSEHVLEALEMRPDGAPPLNIHIKVDTGMSRIGLHDTRQAIAFIERALAIRSVRVEGIYTHFARADEADKAPTKRQHERMNEVVEHFRLKGVEFPYVHSGNSAAAIDTPQYCYNMVRLGISMYGLYPSPEVNRSRIRLEPVLTFATEVIMVKTLPPGTPVSYGGTYVTRGYEQIATLPVGYGDGYSRMLSGKAMVLIGGRRVPVVGRICMDQCMVNVTGMDVRPGDEAVLIGRQGEEEILADELAEWLGTFNYEIVCMIADRVPKVYMKEGRRVAVENHLLQ